MLRLEGKNKKIKIWVFFNLLLATKTFRNKTVYSFLKENIKIVDDPKVNGMLGTHANTGEKEHGHEEIELIAFEQLDTKRHKQMLQYSKQTNDKDDFGEHRSCLHDVHFQIATAQIYLQDFDAWTFFSLFVGKQAFFNHNTTGTVAMRIVSI